ncbi:hypothetical protein MPTK1_1g26900 [Marchantia polymorpha subsp. ruderalis]
MASRSSSGSCGRRNVVLVCLSCSPGSADTSFVHMHSTMSSPMIEAPCLFSEYAAWTIFS